MPNKSNCIDCNKICFPRSTIKRCRDCYHSHERIGKLSKKDYRKQWSLRLKYGIDLVDLDTLWFAFKGKCGICDKNLTLPTSTQGQKLTAVCVDHDHETGNIRGLLCGACNRGVGLLEDSKERVYSAYKYLGGSNE